MRSVDEMVPLIEQEISRLLPEDDSVAAVRQEALRHVLMVLRESGFPKDKKQRLDVSLVPFVFQEANYDDIDWTNRQASLHHLSGILSIDIMVQMGGRERHELNDDDYQDYVAISFAAIRGRSR